MKYIVLSLLLLSSFLLPAQSNIDSQVKGEIQDVADLVASQLMDCCTSFSTGKKLTAKVDYSSDSNGRSKTRISTLAQTLTIAMRVSWRGGWTGTLYWIDGTLTVDLSSGKRTWRKNGDSGGFNPGCSNGCVK